MFSREKGRAEDKRAQKKKGAARTGAKERNPGGTELSSQEREKKSEHKKVYPEKGKGCLRARRTFAQDMPETDQAPVTLPTTGAASTWVVIGPAGFPCPQSTEIAIDGSPNTSRTTARHTIKIPPVLGENWKKES
jgi:hypothetical protein